MDRYYVKGVTVGQMEESAKEVRKNLENNLMQTILSGGVFAECEEIRADYEKWLNQIWATQIAEIDYAMGVRERNRKYLEGYQTR